MTRVNNIAVLVDPIADWEERFVAGSFVSDMGRTESIVGDGVYYKTYRSVVHDFGVPVSSVKERRHGCSATDGGVGSVRSQTGSKPSMIDLINWND